MAAPQRRPAKGAAARGKTSSSLRRISAEPARASKRKTKSDGHAIKQPPTKKTRNGSRVQHQERAHDCPEINRVPQQVLRILVFGNGEGGELGLGPNCTESNTPHSSPFFDPDPRSPPKFRAVQVACGGMHTVVLTADNQIVTWGVNDEGALGRKTDWKGGVRDVGDDDDDDDDDDGSEDVIGDLNPLESTPMQVPAEHFDDADARFSQVAAGDSCSFVLTTRGNVYGWGTFRNSKGDKCFGHDAHDRSIEHAENPILIRGIKGIVQIACGINHVLALDQRGTIWGWGVNEESQLGPRPFGRDQNSYIPAQIRAGRGRSVYIATGQCHSFAVDSRGDVWAWGRNSNCEAGHSAAEVSDRSSCLLRPTKIPHLTGRNVRAISGGANHSCAVTADGHCFAWGKMDTGQLGIDFSDEQLQDKSLIRRGIRDRPEVCTIPTLVRNIGHVVGVACGTDHTIFVDADGQAYATGFGEQGQLGLGSENNVSVAQPICAKSLKGRNISWAGAGGGFSVVAEAVD